MEEAAATAPSPATVATATAAEATATEAAAAMEAASNMETAATDAADGGGCTSGIDDMALKDARLRRAPFSGTGCATTVDALTRVSSRSIAAATAASGL